MTVLTFLQKRHIRKSPPYLVQVVCCITGSAGEVPCIWLEFVRGTATTIEACHIYWSSNACHPVGRMAPNMAKAACKPLLTTQLQHGPRPGPCSTAACRYAYIEAGWLSIVLNWNTLRLPLFNDGKNICSLDCLESTDESIVFSRAEVFQTALFGGCCISNSYLIAALAEKRLIART
jgi:hypothetical protein